MTTKWVQCRRCECLGLLDQSADVRTDLLLLHFSTQETPEVFGECVKIMEASKRKSVWGCVLNQQSKPDNDRRKLQKLTHSEGPVPLDRHKIRRKKRSKVTIVPVKKKDSGMKE